MIKIFFPIQNPADFLNIYGYDLSTDGEKVLIYPKSNKIQGCTLSALDFIGLH